MDERTKMELSLSRYTFKILGYYMEHKQLPSLQELMEMQRQTLDEPLPQLWANISRPRMRD